MLRRKDQHGKPLTLTAEVGMRPGYRAAVVALRIGAPASLAADQVIAEHPPAAESDIAASTRSP